MSKRTLRHVLLATLSIASVSAQAQQKMPAANARDAGMNAFVSNLMKQMTLEEKIGQLNLPAVGFDVTGPVVSEDVDGKIRRGLVGGVFNTFTPQAVRKLQEMAVTQSRLKIPLLFGYDVIHGHRTIFPIPLGLASSWDTALVRRTARVAAEEASADGLNWTFSPMVDIARDPRWGRVAEGAGEDPFLGSHIGVAMVKGYQGSGLGKDPSNIMACVKHFALYGAAEAGRDYSTVDMSRVRMYNEYLPPYKASIQAGAATVMSSFNEVDGVPATANRWLMTDVLRKQYGFTGMVVTDYTAINEMMAHGLGDGAEVARRAIKAPVQMDMVGELFIKELPGLVKAGKVSEAEVNDACRIILESKYKLGLFSNPYRFVDEQRNKTMIMNAAQLATAKEAAIKSMVLLKNEEQTLPLKTGQKVLVVGPFAQNSRDYIGSWSGAGDPKQVKPLLGVLAAAGGLQVTYAKGCNLTDDTSLAQKLNPHGAGIVPDAMSPAQLIDEAVQRAAGADVVVAMLGEPFGMSGEAASRSDIGLLPNQLTLLKALYATGKPVVLVLMNGRPLTLEWESKHMAAILEAWYPGTMGAEALTDVLTGKANPSGKLTMTFPRNVGQIPIYYNHKNTGRPFDEKQKYTSKYLDVSNEPLYAFGHGLSYTRFSYSEPRVSNVSPTGNASITAEVQVTNTGAVAGEEVVQLYIQDKVGTITRPVNELKGFSKLMLQPGETKTVRFTIDTQMLSFYNHDLVYGWEAGEFIIGIGGSSHQLKRTSVNWKK